MRNLEFTNDKFYHIYNRGVDKREVFIDDYDFIRFLKYIRIFMLGEQYQEMPEAKPPQPPKGRGRLSLFASVEMICYCLNPNHYHFLLRQLKDGGVTALMHFLATSYTMYFNAKYKRSGSLFQGPFKATEITSVEHLVHMSVYINTNAQIHGLHKDASDYIWCSYPDYLEKRNGTLCSKKSIFESFNNTKDYKEFVDKHVIFIKENKKLQKYFLE